jgi:hypothetical protein
MLCLLQHLSSPLVLVGFIFLCLVFCVVYFRSLFVLLATEFSVFLQFMASDYPFGIFKHFLVNMVVKQTGNLP